MDSNLNLDILPPEIVTQFLLRLSLKDLINYCLTSKTANAYCKDDAFWKDKYRYDFGLPIPKNPTKLWIDLYKGRMAFKNSPISVGKDHYAIIDDQGILYTGGNNGRGQLGNGTFNGSEVPFEIKSFIKKVISVSCGLYFTIAITEDGKAYGWGANRFTKSQDQQLLVPTLIDELKNYRAVKVSCGDVGWGVILSDASVYVSFSLVIDYIGVKIEGKIDIDYKIVDISVYKSHFALVTRSGKLYFAGEDFSVYNRNEDKFIGIEDSENKITVEPKHIPFPPQQGIIPKIKQVSLTGSHIMALTEDGDVFTWGSNYAILLCLPNNTDKSNLYLSPQRITSLPKISYISVAVVISAVVTTDGRLYIWGKNELMNYIPNLKEDDARFINLSGIKTAIVPIEMNIGSRVNYVAMGRYLTMASTIDGMVKFI